MVVPDEEGRKKTRASQWTSKETAVTLMWAVLGFIFFFGGSKYLSAHPNTIRSLVGRGSAALSGGSIRGSGMAKAGGEDGRSMLSWHRALSSKSELNNPLLEMSRIEFADVQAASDEEANQLAATIFFAPPDAETCKLTWIPRSRAEKPGGWPMCDKVPRPVPSRCHMYSVGVTMPPEFDLAGATELGCNVRSFDPNLDSIGSLPHGVTFESVGMSADIQLETKPKTGTLSTLMSYKHEQGRHLFLIKFDCEGCEWESFEQQLKDLGPDAFHDYDMIMIKLNFGSKGYSPKRVAALAALLYNQAFTMYYRHPHGAAVGAAGTEPLLAAVEAVHGAEAAHAHEASVANLIKLGQAESTHKEADAKKLAVEGTVLSVVELAFVREMALPHKTLLVEREYVKCAGPEQ